MNDEEQKLVVTELPREEENTRTATRTGASEMRCAADMVLNEKCIEIARSLADGSAHIQGTKFLYELGALYEEHGQGEGVRKLRSLASELALEEQWLSEPAEDDAEMAAGSREPEGEQEKPS